MEKLFVKPPVKEGETEKTVKKSRNAFLNASTKGDTFTENMAISNSSTGDTFVDDFANSGAYTAGGGESGYTPIVATFHADAVYR